MAKQFRRQSASATHRDDHLDGTRNNAKFRCHYWATKYLWYRPPSSRSSLTFISINVVNLFSGAQASKRIQCTMNLNELFVRLILTKDSLAKILRHPPAAARSPEKKLSEQGLALNESWPSLCIHFAIEQIVSTLFTLLCLNIRPISAATCQALSTSASGPRSLSGSLIQLWRSAHYQMRVFNGKINLFLIEFAACSIQLVSDLLLPHFFFIKRSPPFGQCCSIRGSRCHPG